MTKYRIKRFSIMDDDYKESITKDAKRKSTGAKVAGAAFGSIIGGLGGLATGNTGAGLLGLAAGTIGGYHLGGKLGNKAKKKAEESISRYESGSDEEKKYIRERYNKNKSDNDRNAAIVGSALLIKNQMRRNQRRNERRR